MNSVAERYSSDHWIKKNPNVLKNKVPSIEIGKTIYGVICTVVVLLRIPGTRHDPVFFVVGYNFVADNTGLHVSSFV